MSKSLSNGTLSLRFMQNALRRQNLQEIELKRAEIKDEGKWEVAQDIKDAWGKQPSDSVAHESSYLPFLFPSEREDIATSTPKPRGRRTFNKHGLDVSQDRSQPQLERNDVDDDDVPGDKGAAVTTEMDDAKGHKVRIHASPVPLSESSLGNRSLQGLDTFDTSKTTRRSRSARDAVFSSSDAGTDLRAGSKSFHALSSQICEGTPKEQEQAAPSIGFLKPMGVDEPATRNFDLTSSNTKTLTKTRTPKPSVSNVIDGARKKKRDRNPNEQGVGEKKKKRKIRKSILSRPTNKE